MSRARDRADGVLHNRTHEDTEGGRESLITFKGEQSGGEISTLAQIQASHDGTADDQKGDLILRLMTVVTMLHLLKLCVLLHSKD